MGGDKMLAELDGRPLLLHAVEVLGSVVDEVAVVAKPGTALPPLPPGVEVWFDEDPLHHPLVGIATALRRAGGRPVLAVAGDMPRLTPAVLRAVLDAPPAAVAVARADGRVQPLLARWDPAALDALDLGRSATAVVESLDPVVVDVPAAAVANVNAPEDLSRT